MLQPPGIRRFNEDSAFKRHWPLLWLTGLSALIVAIFVSDFYNLGRIFDTGKSDKFVLVTQYIFQNSNRRLSYRSVVPSSRAAHNSVADRLHQLESDGERFANTITYHGYPYATEMNGEDQLRRPGESGSSLQTSVAVQDCRTYLNWLFHRRIGLYSAQHQDYEVAQNELSTSLRYAEKLNKTYPCKALSLGDMALVAELRAVEMQQVAQMLLKAALPIFSFWAALLPFALFLIFIKSRDKADATRGESETAGARLFLKTMLLASWFGVIVTGWVALRNYGMGIAVGLSDPAALAFFSALAALVLSCCLMLRYMPPYKSLSLKRTMVSFGFGGALLALKAVVIYLGLCFSLAGHPALKNVLFCESLYLGKAAQAKNIARQASECAQQSMAELPFIQAKLLNNMSEVLTRAKFQDIEKSRADQIRRELAESCDEDLSMPQNKDVPYLFRTHLASTNLALLQQPISLRNLTVGMILKACLAYLFLFCPEFLAYIWLGLKQRKLALRTFELAIKIKEYFFGIDHWLVVGMMELFGSCLLTFHKQVDLSAVGEDYLHQAITRYERSRGRHDQLTIAAKMALAHFHSEQGDDKKAEHILLEALRDVGKDFDTLAYCDLLSEIGKLFCRRHNYSRAKQMYKQVIELLEQKLAKLPPSQGFVGYFHNIYATTPTWQLEVKLVYAYLDLAEVFHQAKYNGEAQRLTDDAARRISAFEGEMVVVMEVATAYARAKIAVAKILCAHGRHDECFKVLADAKKHMQRWGYGRFSCYFELVVAECELGILASKGFSKYSEAAKKNYRDGVSRFGAVYSMPNAGNLKERWREVGENLGAGGMTAMSRVVCGMGASLFTAPGDDALKAPARPAQAEAGAKAAESPATGPIEANLAAQSGSVTGAGLKAIAGYTHNVAPSQVIMESRQAEDEGIIIRWQRERKEEIKLELKPERG